MRDLTASCRLAAATCACIGVRAASRVLTQIYDEALRPSGIGITQFTVLVAAGFVPDGAPVSRLAQRLAMDRTTLTRHLAPLVADRLVEVTPLPEDARTKTVRLSAKGRRALEKAMPLWEKIQQRVEAGLGDAQFADLQARLKAVVELPHALGRG